jgi:outer membrane protein assembly factor BamA
MNRKQLTALFVFLLLSTALVAQARFTMQTIVFKGARHYTDQQLLAFTGMKVGGSYTQDDLQNTANKLNATGLFRQVAYKFSSSTAEYDLVENTDMLPARFDNFVWMSDAELSTKLKSKLPLYMGDVPQEGTFGEDVEHAVEGVLAELGVKDAKVQFMALNEKGVYTAMNYTVLEPHVLLSAIEFKDATPDVSPGLQEVVKKSIGDDYTQTVISGLVDARLLPVLHKNGYIKAYFGSATAKLVTAVGAPEAKVAVSVPVIEGPQYKIATLTMKGDDAVAKESAKQLSEFKTGVVANLPGFRLQLSQLGGTYITKGYMNAKVKAVPTFDDTAHTVSYEIELVPGDLYKLTKLDMQGLDESQRAKVAKIWTLHEGDPFDGTYAQTFLKKNEAKLGFLNGYQIAWKQRVNDDTKTVELEVFFRKMAGQGQ